jgi:hypothetical protein
LDWNNFPESIRSSLVSLIQLPTVTSLYIHSFHEFPASAFSGCGNLIDLRLGELNLAPPGFNQVISRSKTPTPESLYINTTSYDGLAALLNSENLLDPIVDFSRLQKADFEVNSPGDICQVNELIKLTTRLEYLCIDTYTDGE